MVYRIQSLGSYICGGFLNAAHYSIWGDALRTSPDMSFVVEMSIKIQLLSFVLYALWNHLYDKTFNDMIFLEQFILQGKIVYVTYDAVALENLLMSFLNRVW